MAAEKAILPQECKEDISPVDDMGLNACLTLQNKVDAIQRWAVFNYLYLKYVFQLLLSIL